ncbi:WD40-repeat-containing domain protein [Mycena albidolilacea]|uniref:WD40-repeat-containing domain protein n=1 Tax=Mycena albidolilacea TaxID=1033008 RepID=A0AAD6Z0S5_9AGAR|nr:WD40-repeat-containing domain protein [Mycena albidolilacea]
MAPPIQCILSLLSFLLLSTMTIPAVGRQEILGASKLVQRPTASNPWVSELTRIETNGNKAGAVAVSENSTLVATVVEREIRVYGVGSSRLLRTLRGHAGFIKALEFQPGGSKLVSSSALYGCSMEQAVRVWDLDAGAPPNISDDAAKAAVTGASPILLQHWSAEDIESANLREDIAKVILKAQITVDVRNGRAFFGELPSFEARAFSRNGSSLLYLPHRQTVAVADVDTLTERFRLTDNGHTDGVMWAETSPNGTVVATSSWDQTVRIWSMESGKLVHILRGARGQSWAGAFSPNGELVAAGAGDGMVRIWRIDTGELLHTLGNFRGWVRSLSFSPDSRHLAAGAAGGTLKVFNVESGEQELNWQTFAGELLNVQYTFGGDLFFSSTDGSIFGYRASQDSKWEFFEPGSFVGGVKISADGSKLIATVGSSVRIWKIE